MADPVLHGSMSYDQVLEIFRTYSDYDLTATPNPTRARIFIQAGRMLLSPAIRRSSQASRSEEVELEPEILQDLVTKAVRWLGQYNASVLGPRQLVPAPDWREE